MENPKVSVIIPIYNVEDYLEDTLNNLLNQTFINNMEVIMVDDGSTDNSRYIIEKYALDYDNFHAFHKENEGPSVARNYGLDRAKGEYVHFLDADDSVVDNGYEKLYNIAIENDSNIVTAPVIRLKRYNIFDGKFYKNSLKKFNQNIYSTKFENYPELIWDLFITNKLYKREFLNKNNLRLIEVDKAYCDDSPFSLMTYLRADNISISTDIFYYWRVRQRGELSITQKLDEIQTFYDRLYSNNFCLNEINKFQLPEQTLKEFYLKLLNHDLYLHFNKFYKYDEKYHLDLIRKTKPILDCIPDEYKEEINSFKRIVYKMVEDEDTEGLVNFTCLESELKENPHIPSNLNEKYQKYIDFNQDIIEEDLIIRKAESILDGDNLIIQFNKRLNFLKNDYPHETVVKLIDDEGEEFLLKEEDSKIFIPIGLIKNKNHMRIKVECIFDSLKKETYLTNSRRELIKADGFDIEIGIGINNLLYIDIRETNDLLLEIEDIIFEENIFKFSGISNKEITNVYIQNVVTFEKIHYDVKAEQEEEKYKISFLIPYADILSFKVRKCELKVDGGFEDIKIDHKFEFYMQHNFIYIMNIRDNLLISSDFYNIFEKLNSLKSNADNARAKNKKYLLNYSKLKEKNTKLTEKNTELKDKNSNLKDKNSKLTKENAELKETVNSYKNRKIVKFVDKIKGLK